MSDEVLSILVLAAIFAVVGTVAALAVSSTMVDVSPYSTNGALVMANAKGVDQDAFYRQLLVYGAVIVAVVPPLAWLVLIVIGG